MFVPYNQGFNLLHSALQGGGEVLMYCVKCRAKREGKDIQEVTMKNGKKAKKGKCEVCGTTMFRIGG
ncbi:MAG: hypothetical protein US67_C0020G0014 [Candidatus Woesebacteria bacterium GW2011_GWD1_38_10]|uniref:DUF5679 domain-containing protein n=1 Tax=Candidatus Woesebacteria bacterium GW2011_GWD1_38_10 TaxID=1618592 RepID=A0A0G0IDE3_9BACT|nr:MAG: hypothetical protein US67_C0020G0014 [Candidatus Woesebacteria bacterium GW2011_GWD1_38_10]